MHKISEKKVKEIIKDLKKYKKLDNKKHNRQYYYDAKRAVVDSEILSSELVKEFLDAYNDCRKSNKGLITESIETDDRAEIGVERDDDGNIQYYTFEIYRKNTPALIGKLTRNDMEIIMKLYSIYGANLTQKIVSREFPMYTFVEFKRILRAFNIYKQDYIPKHWLEELSEEEIICRCEQQKESNIMRRLEKDELSQYKKLTNKLASKLQIYENKLELAKELLNSQNDFSQFVLNERNILNNSNLIIYLSDLHIGAFNEPNGYLTLANYNEKEIRNRLFKVFTIPNLQNYDKIIVMNLGDSVDSYNKETTRGGHELPTIISNKEQSQLYLKIMMDFFVNLQEINSNLEYYCIGESNHDGDWGWLNNVVLSEKLKSLNINSYISDKPIDYININDYSIIYLHGKNIKDQFKGFPLTLDKKTESWFNDFFVDCDFDLKRNKLVVKGDLHQFAITEGHNFQYLSVASMYGSSQYIVSNFGKTKWGITYMEINNNLIKIGNIKENDQKNN